MSTMATSDLPSEDLTSTGNKYELPNPRGYPPGAVEYLSQLQAFPCPSGELYRRFRCYAEAFGSNDPEIEYNWVKILEPLISDYIVHNGATLSKADFINQLSKERDALQHLRRVVIEDENTNVNAQLVSARLTVFAWDDEARQLAHIGQPPGELMYEHGFYYFKNGKLSAVYNSINKPELDELVTVTKGPVYDHDMRCRRCGHERDKFAEQQNAARYQFEDSVIVTADDADLPAEWKTAEKNEA